MRLLIDHEGTLRRLAYVELGHDGSINIGLPRDGVITTAFQLSGQTGGTVQVVEFDSPRERTKRLSIHISGRINFKWSTAPSPVFIPCLLDLQQPAHVVTYVVPDTALLDTVGGHRKDDQLIDLPFAASSHVAFAFEVLPWTHPVVEGEIARIVFAESYALRCMAVAGDIGIVAAGFPAAGFCVLTTTGGRLASLAVPEDEAYLRFQRHCHSRGVQEAAVNARKHMEITDEMVATEIARGPGIIAPTVEGIWTAICAVPMHRKPDIQVVFKKPWHRAELIDFKPDDKRLEKVRVRFRVQDTRSGSWVKGPVEICAIFLDAEL